MGKNQERPESLLSGIGGSLLMPMNQKQFDKFYKDLKEKEKEEQNECKICHLEVLTSDTIERGICENCEDEN